MLAYTAGRPRIGERRSSPNTLLFIISGHIALVAAVMSAKMGLAPDAFDPPTTVVSIPISKPPPPPVPTQRTRQMAQPTEPHRASELARTIDPQIPIDLGTSSEPVPTGDTGGAANPILPSLPQPVPVSTPAQPMTSPSDLKPPYPQSKLLSGEEAALTLRLTIDERGRVVAVDPIGRADSVFLSAARRHLIAHWRYKPAMQDGRAVGSTLVVTLRFELDD